MNRLRSSFRMPKLVATLCVFALGFLFYSCNSNELVNELNEDLRLKEILGSGITSLEDFDILVTEEIHPVSKLSTEAVEAFKASLVFKEEVLVSGYFKNIVEELSVVEQAQFWELLYGQSFEIVNEKDLTLKQSELEFRGCNPTHGLGDYKNSILGCTYQPFYWCVLCDHL